MSGGNISVTCRCCGREYGLEYNYYPDTVTPFLIDGEGEVIQADCPGLADLIQEAWPVLFGYELDGDHPCVRHFRDKQYDDPEAFEEAGYGRAA